VEIVKVRTATEMRYAIIAHLDDATIIVKPKDEGKVDVVETPSGTTVTASTPVTKLSFEVTDGGALTSTGAAIKQAKFSFTGAGSVEITNDVAKDIKVLGSDYADNVSLGDGDLGAGTTTKNAKIVTGAGADSVTAAGSSLKNIRIDLGVDNEADNVTIDSDISTVKNMVIKNFGQEDTFTVGGDTYTYDQLKADPKAFKPNITFKFS